jgi:hypothetical protein
METAKEILLRVAEEKQGYFLSAQVSWITEAMEEYANFKDEKEVSVYSAVNKHNKCLELLEAILSFEKRKKDRLKNVEHYKDYLPTLSKKYQDNVEIIDRCIDRLKQRYLLILKNI